MQRAWVVSPQTVGCLNGYGWVFSLGWKNALTIKHYQICWAEPVNFGDNRTCRQVSNWIPVPTEPLIRVLTHIIWEICCVRYRYVGTRKCTSCHFVCESSHLELEVQYFRKCRNFKAKFDPSPLGHFGTPEPWTGSERLAALYWLSSLGTEPNRGPVRSGSTLRSSIRFTYECMHVLPRMYCNVTTNFKKSHDKFVSKCERLNTQQCVCNVDSV